MVCIMWQYCETSTLSLNRLVLTVTLELHPHPPQVPVTTHCRCPEDTSPQAVPLRRVLQVDLYRNSQIER